MTTTSMAIALLGSLAEVEAAYPDLPHPQKLAVAKRRAEEFIAFLERRWNGKDA